MSGFPSLNDDLKELISLFLSHDVEFMVVGAHALAYYASPRFTEDLDLFLSRSSENAAKLAAAMRQFGLPFDQDALARFVEEERAMIVLGRKPHQVDLLNFLDGVSFSSAATRCEEGVVGGSSVPIISKLDLIQTKRATGRPKDLEDLRRLLDGS